MVVNAAGHRLRDSRRLLQILERGTLDRAGGAEMHQQSALAAGADAGDVVERVGGESLRPFLAMGADREAVRLVAQPLEIEEQRRVGRQGDFAAAGQMEYLA